MSGKSPEQESGPQRAANAKTPTSLADGEVSYLPPSPVISPLLARRLNAKVLDPDSVPLAPGQAKPLPTVYVADTLLVSEVVVRRGGDDFRTGRVDELKRLGAALEDSFDVEAVGTPIELRLPDRSSSDSDFEEALVSVTRVRITSNTDVPVKAPDAWRFLQTARARRRLPASDGTTAAPDATTNGPPAGAAPAANLSRAESYAAGVSLEHVLTAAGGVWGGVGGVWGGVGGVWGGVGGVWGGVGGVWGGVGGAIAEYGTPGIGGRTPVVWSAPDPRRGIPIPEKPPVIAVLDTGLGLHPWFKEEVVDTATGTTTGTRCRAGAVDAIDFGIGLSRDPSRDPENTGVIFDEVNGLIDVLCGHGTFVAGVIRQRCPEATILSVPVMAGDGVALEGDILDALSKLLARHQAASEQGSTVEHGVLDVVNLSLGYYHETPEDASDDALHTLLAQFVDSGVVVVAAAGNDATQAPFFPAGFAQAMAPGLIGVGATNPDGDTVALFSNNGRWVTAHAPGAGIVSTVPTTLSGSGQAGVLVNRNDPGPRSTVDFDDFSSGFAIWSGTSFAAPWIAGEIAAHILNPDTPGTEETEKAQGKDTTPRSVLAARAVIAESRKRFEAK